MSRAEIQVPGTQAPRMGHIVRPTVPESVYEELCLEVGDEVQKNLRYDGKDNRALKMVRIAESKGRRLSPEAARWAAQYEEGGPGFDAALKDMLTVQRRNTANVVSSHEE